MNKPNLLHSVRKWTGSLAVCGLVMLGACDSDERPATDELNSLEMEPVSQTVETTEYDDETVTEEPATTTDQVSTDQTSNTTTTSQWNQWNARYSGNSVAINALLAQYPTVNTAIRNSLSDMDATYSSGVQGHFAASATSGMDQQDQNLRYDAMTNTDVADITTEEDRKSPESITTEQMRDEDYQMLLKEYEDVNREIREVLRQNPGVSVQYTDNYSGVYTGVENDELRMQLQELENRRVETRERMRGQLDTRTNTYLATEVDAAPQVSFDELYDFIEDQITYPVNAQAAGIEGTIFVEFTVDQQGNVLSPTVIETIEGQQMPIKTPLNPTRVNEQERKEAIAQMEQEALKAVSATSGMWNPAMMGEERVAETVQLPVRFQLDTLGR